MDNLYEGFFFNFAYSPQKYWIHNYFENFTEIFDSQDILGENILGIFQSFTQILAILGILSLQPFYRLPCHMHRNIQTTNKVDYCK